MREQALISAGEACGGDRDWSGLPRMYHASQRFVPALVARAVQLLDQGTATHIR